MMLDEEKFQPIFEKTKARYASLRDVNVKLQFSRGLFFTMRASVKVVSLFSKKRKYIIYINLNREKDVLSKLSEDDLVAWFGHELAHVIDYESMSNFGLAIFTFKYLLNLKFRLAVEKRIHAFEYNNGFAVESFGAWKKFLSLDTIGNKYKEYGKKCRPDWADIEQTAMSHGITKEFFDSFK